MKFEVVAPPLSNRTVDAWILPYVEGADGPGEWLEFDSASGGLVAEGLASAAFRSKRGATLAMATRGALPCREVILLGLGKAAELDLEAWRLAVASATQSARDRGAETLAIAVPGSGPGTAAERAAAAAESAVLACYRYTAFKAPAADAGSISEVFVASADPGAPAAVERAVTVASCATWARDLINTPPSDKRPPQLAERAAEMAREHGLSCRIIEEAEAGELGLRALLAVGRGSTAAPRLVALEHSPAAATGAPIVLVGKGVTFDTGGISIKPAQDMDHMKSDMSGAAAVLATMRAVAQLQLPLRVIGITPMAENMPDGDAYRPGDLVRAYNGKTIEVLNTDAEGRLILADALAWAVDQYKPSCVVDLATLTGACVVALGSEIAGLMSNDQALATQLLAAATRTGEHVWQMPMLALFRKQIDSPVADIKNTGGREGGAITAAKFLQEFVGDTPWAHLDIAGPSYTTKPAGYRTHGGVGFGVRLLIDWLQSRAEVPA